ncbi:MAG: hypothetical protein L0226_13750 [Acidobacteria bacterium]|nr:hypothetical protein [Acidobacteriota bacterium]
MMQANTEQIRRYMAVRFPDADFDDKDIESIAAMPIAAYMCELWIRDLNTLLRALPDGLLFDHAYELAQDFRNWGDLKDPNTWPRELLALAVILSDDKLGEDEERRAFRLSHATARLAAQAFIECARRTGMYSFVEDYTLTREVRTAPRLENFTEH